MENFIKPKSKKERKDLKREKLRDRKKDKQMSQQKLELTQNVQAPIDNNVTDPRSIINLESLPLNIQNIIKEALVRSRNQKVIPQDEENESKEVINTHKMAVETPIQSENTSTAEQIYSNQFDSLESTYTSVSPHKTLEEVRAARNREENIQRARNQEVAYQSKVTNLPRSKKISEIAQDEADYQKKVTQLRNPISTDGSATSSELPSNPVVPVEQLTDPKLKKSLAELKNAPRLDNSDLSQYLTKQKPRQVDTSSKAA